jgi:hypothetical protein
MGFSGAGHDAGFLEFNGAQREAIVRFQINVYNFASSPLTFKSLGDRLMSVGRMASWASWELERDRCG